jgi:RNA polymerase sigma-70 factor (ECF subfamily)
MSTNRLSDEFIRELTRMQPRLYGYIFKRLMNPDSTQEILQETNLVLCRKHADFIPGSNFSAWSFQIAHFQILAFRQRRSRERLVFDDDVLERFSIEECTDSSHTAKRMQALELCLQKLPSNHRKLIAARYTKHGNVKAVAEQLGKTPNAISKLLQRTRSSLMNCIEENLGKANA